MFHIVVHCCPNKENEEHFGKVSGAYASILIDYKDYDGAVELSKFYIRNNEWDVLELDEEYYTFEKKEDLPEDYQQYYPYLEKYGYSMIFNLYHDDEA